MTRNWGVVLVAAGMCIPPAIVKWLKTERKTSEEK
jgi:hypothetical protein